MKAELSTLGEKILEFAVPTIIAVVLVAGLASGLTGEGATVANGIVSGISSNITTYWPLYVTMVFVFAIYGLYLANKGRKKGR
jgi:hypothetical protein